MWQPDHHDDATVIWHLSRDMLVEVSAGPDGLGHGEGNVTAVKMGGLVLLWLESPEGRVCLLFKTEPLAAFVRSSLSMCPIEGHGTPNKPDEAEVFAATVDGLIQQIFNHAERTDS